MAATHRAVKQHLRPAAPAGHAALVARRACANRAAGDVPFAERPCDSTALALASAISAGAGIGTASQRRFCRGTGCRRPRHAIKPLAEGAARRRSIKSPVTCREQRRVQSH
jgi:hypothetical protein